MPNDSHEYNQAAVDAAIRQSRKRIGRKEAQLIHSLLRCIAGQEPAPLR